MQVSGSEHCRQRDCQCKGPGVGTCLCLGTAKKGISANNWGRGHVASKPLQEFGLSLELPHLTGFEGDPSCEDPNLPPK